MPRLFLVLFFMVMGLNFSWAQYMVSGLVINKKANSPLIGCSVYNVSKQRGTITNEDGEYTIGADKGDLIQFSYIGMAIEERYVVDGSDMDIEMVYQVRKLRNVNIVSGSLARNSILFNPKYDKKEKEFIEPVLKSADELIKDAGPKIGGTGISMSPITMLYYAFNKRERRRLDALMDINKMDMSNSKYSLDFISMVTRVDDVAELKDIKAYCYFPHDQVIHSSYYELGLLLKECYIEYLEYRKTHPLPPMADPAKDSIPKDEFMLR